MLRDMFITGCMLLLIHAGCKQNELEQTKSITELQEENGYPVRIQRAAVDELFRMDRQGGVVKGVYQTTVSVGVSGTISSLKVETGSSVRAGGTLATVDPDGASPYLLAKTEFENAKKSYERIQALEKAGGVSQDVLDQIEARYDVAAENLSAARKTVNITAPFSGVVLDVMERLNSKVGPGTMIAKIAKVDEVAVELSVNEAVINEYSEGQNAFVILDDDTLWGEVSKIGAGANEHTHAFPVTVSFNNHKRLLKPGTFVTVGVITAQKQAMILPMDIIQMDDNGAFVFRVSDGKAHYVPIKLGIRGDNGYEITSGIKEGDLIVLQGAGLLNDGVKIRIVD